MVAVAVGSFAQPAGTGNAVISGLKFSPKVVMFIGNEQTADGNSTTNTVFAIGAAATSAARFAFYIIGSAAAGWQDWIATKAYRILGVTGTVLGDFDYVSSDPDGFTINWSTTDGTARIVNYIAIGGAEITTKISTLTNGTGTTNTSFTGIGFKPDTVIAMGSTNGGAGGPPSSSSSAAVVNVGWGTNANGIIGNVSNGSSTRGSGNGNQGQYQLSKFIVSTTFSLSSIGKISTLVSMDADGFTVNYTTNNGVATIFEYIAIKGITISGTFFNQPTSNGSQQVTMGGFQPQALIFHSLDRVTNAAVFNPGDFSTRSTGACTTAAAFCCWYGCVNVGNLNGQSLDRSNAIATLSAGPPTTVGSATLTSMSNNGFFLNWSSEWLLASQQ